MHSKQWHYSLHRDFQNCYSTRRSPTGFFSSNYNSNSTRVPIQQVSSIHHTTYKLHAASTSTRAHYTTSTSREFSIQKSNSTCRRQRALRVLPLHYKIPDSRNSTHRRQGDLLEMHPCVLQDLPVTFQAFSHKSLQRQLQLLQLLQRHSSLSRHSRHSSLSSLSRHSSRSRHSRDIPDIPVIHDLPAFPGNSSNSTLFQYLQGFHPIPAFSN